MPIAYRVMRVFRLRCTLRAAGPTAALKETRDMQDKKAVLVIGAGDATGGAIARRFAREGYVACMTRRHAEKLAPLVAAIEQAGGEAHAFGSDARKEEDMAALIDTIEREVGEIEVA